MFSSETLSFLSDLKANNTRDWFTEHKTRYEMAVKRPTADVADRLATDLSRATGVPHRSKIFRMHRDLRFSKDKTPYNTHIHLSFLPEGGASTPPAWMLGLSPEYFTLGCGVMGFDKAGLDRFRDAVAADDGTAIAKVLDDLAGDGIRLSEPELKRVPAPWPKDHPHSMLLRRKSLVGWIDGVNPEAGTGPDMPDRALVEFARLRPLFDLLMSV